MKVFKISPAAVAATIACALATTVSAATLYVNPDGICGGHSPCFTTIQAAVNAAASGDTIQVAAGTYPELVQVTKTLTIDGANAGVDPRGPAPRGAESIVGMANGAFQIEADKVVIDGFTIQGVTNDPHTTPAALEAGVWTNPGFSGTQGGFTIENNIIQNNIIGIYLQNTGTLQAKVEQNLIQNNNAPGSSSGTGIYSDVGLSNVLIDNNKFVGQTNASINLIGAVGTGVASILISNNTLDAGIGMFGSSGITIDDNTSIGNTIPGTIYIGGGDSNITIFNNVLDSGVEAVVIENAFGAGTNSAVTLSPDNCIAGNSTNGLRVASGTYTGGAGSLNATDNWWGSATGPTIASNPGGTGDKITDPDGVVTYSPFLTSDANTPCAGAAPTPTPTPTATPTATPTPTPTATPTPTPTPGGGTVPTMANQCKKGGWRNLVDDHGNPFKNQGDCVSFVRSHRHGHGH
jgi:hypothetical protein